MRHRHVAALSATLATLVAAVAGVAPASGMAPTTQQISFSGGDTIQAGTLCPFDITYAADVEGVARTFYDQDGAISERITVGSEQDTFHANGKTLVGSVYHWKFDAEFVDGIRVAVHSDAVTELVPLPGGGMFVIAGRADVTNLGPTFLFVDSGNDGNNVAGFCAALS